MYTAETLRVQSGLKAVGLLWRRRMILLGPWSSWHIQLLLMLRASLLIVRQFALRTQCRTVLTV